MRSHSLSSQLFIYNREKLSKALHPGQLVILFSSDEMHRNGDQFFSYRANSDVFYLTGISQPETTLEIQCIAPGMVREVLYIKRNDLKTELWLGKRLNQQEAQNISGITEIRYTDELRSYLQQSIGECQQIITNAIPANISFASLQRSATLLNELEVKIPFYDIGSIMGELRVIKHSLEIDAVKKAIDITDEAFSRLLVEVRPGMMEYEIEALVSYSFLRQGADGGSFQTIVASGANACVLHYVQNDHQIQDGDLVLIDFGAEYANYAADCTRTLPANGVFTSRQRQLYLACLRVMNRTRRCIRPGATINELNQICATFWEQEHVELGLYSMNDLLRQSSDQPLVKQYFPHGVSHFLGLDAHDPGSRDRKLEPGMLLTCEPGIYIREEQIGIRLENDILVTNEGNIDLMNHIPIDPDEIEERMHNR